MAALRGYAFGRPEFDVAHDVPHCVVVMRSEQYVKVRWHDAVSDQKKMSLLRAFAYRLQDDVLLLFFERQRIRTKMCRDEEKSMRFGNAAQSGHLRESLPSVAQVPFARFVRKLT